MSKKSELLETAKTLGLELTEKNTIAQIEESIKCAQNPVMEAPESEVAVTEDVAPTEVKLAKAGKKSAKAIAEAEAKAEKEARKAKHDTTPQSEEAESHSKKGPKPVTRPLLERRGKSYREAFKLIDKSKSYSLAEAMELASKTNPSKFNASVELHVKLGVDPRQADQNIRATVSLPNGTGKAVRVAVFAPETDHAAAAKAGADIIGDETFLQQLDKGTIDFDILIATPQYMPKLGKYARLLGPKGLMPNPKSGTVAVNVAKAVTEAKAGKVEYRVDKQSIVHLSIGKVSFGANKLEQNATAFFDSLKAHKPSSLKGQFVKSISTSTTMGPSLKIENNIN
jgi:large subunit ribosomal protein L1